MVCFSCGKSGYAATRCPKLDDSFPFMQPGWQAGKAPGRGGVHYDPTPGDARPTEDGGGGSVGPLQNVVLVEETNVGDTS